MQRMEAGSKSGITGTAPVMATRTRKSNNLTVDPVLKKANTEIDSAQPKTRQSSRIRKKGGATASPDKPEADLESVTSLRIKPATLDKSKSAIETMPANDMKLVQANVDSLLLQPANDATPEKMEAFDVQESPVKKIEEETVLGDEPMLEQDEKPAPAE